MQDKNNKVNKGRPKFKDPKKRNSASMTVCLTEDVKKSLIKIAGKRTPVCPPASLAREIIEKYVNNKRTVDGWT